MKLLKDVPVYKFPRNFKWKRSHKTLLAEGRPRNRDAVASLAYANWRNGRNI